MATREAIALVYNADSGFFNTLADAAHKLLSPSTYECNLCAITHSPLGMRSEWRDFLDGLDVAVEFYHRDELADLGIGQVELPAILERREGRYFVLHDATSINAASSMEDLKRLMEPNRRSAP